MTMTVIPRWTVTCAEHGSTIVGIASEEDAQWFADQHNTEFHPTTNTEEK